MGELVHMYDKKTGKVYEVTAEEYARLVAEAKAREANPAEGGQTSNGTPQGGEKPPSINDLKARELLEKAKRSGARGDKKYGDNLLSSVHNNKA